MALVQKENKKNQDVKRQEFILQLLQEKRTVAPSPKPQHQNPSLHGSKDDKFEDEQRPSNCEEASKPSLYGERFEKECQP